MYSHPTRRLLAAALAACTLAACRGDDPAAAPPAAADTPTEQPAEPAEPSEPPAAPEPEPEPARAPLTGEAIDPELAATLAERPLLIVKIENSPQARPQAGLDVADVVLEELVEGGVTRFIGLFHSDLPEDIGPVRSARPVDVALGSGFGQPVFAYSGARGEVQSMLHSSPMVVLEEGAPGFRRVSDRRAPHNVFIRPDEVLAAGTARGATALPAVPWVFEAEPPAVDCDQPDCPGSGAAITVPMSPSARAGFTYDDGAGVYRRDQNGTASTVTGPGRIGAANVVVLATRHYTGGCCDTNGAPYSETDVVGEGEAIVLRDGQRYAGSWRKAAADQPLELLDATGDRFPLKPGPTWILLPSSGVVAGL